MIKTLNIEQEKEIEECYELYECCKNHTKPRQQVINSLKNLIKYYHPLTTSSYIDPKEAELTTQNTRKELHSLFENKKINELFSKIVKVEKKVKEKSSDLKSISSNQNIGEVLFEGAMKFLEGMVDLSEHQRLVLKKTRSFRFELLKKIYESFLYYGLHPEILNRTWESYCYAIKVGENYHFKMMLSKQELESNYVNKYRNINNYITINGKQLKVKTISETKIIATKLTTKEIPNFCQSKSFSFENTQRSKLSFIDQFENIADNILPKTIDYKSLNIELLKAAVDLKNLLIVRPKLSKKERNDLFTKQREKLKSDSKTWNLTPHFVKEYHSFDEFWGAYKLKINRDTGVSDGFSNLIKFLEREEEIINRDSTEVVLEKFDSPHIRDYWKKSIDKISEDPEEAITRSKSLMESIYKHILDEERIEYDRDIDFPDLHKKVISHLNLSPGKQHDKIFNQILNGSKSIVEGVSALRNKLGSAHGKSREQSLIVPTKIHAELVVSVSGAMAVYIVDNWLCYKQN